MKSQGERASEFRALHQQSQPFVIPNAFDAGTARLLESLGFDAIATTSAGLAFSLGARDGAAGLDATLANCRAICAAVDSSAPIYDFGLAVERVHAAVEAVRALPFPFTLTARAENFLHGRSDLDDTLRRLQAFEKAGADVLYAPLLPNEDAIRMVVSFVGKPVNVLVSSGNASLTYDRLAALGVRRISVGGALSRAAFTAVANAAREIRERGTFTYSTSLLSSSQLDEIFRS